MPRETKTLVLSKDYVRLLRTADRLFPREPKGWLEATMARLLHGSRQWRILRLEAKRRKIVPHLLGELTRPPAGRESMPKYLSLRREIHKASTASGGVHSELRDFLDSSQQKLDRKLATADFDEQRFAELLWEALVESVASAADVGFLAEKFMLRQFVDEIGSKKPRDVISKETFVTGGECRTAKNEGELTYAAPELQKVLKRFQGPLGRMTGDVIDRGRLSRLTTGRLLDWLFPYDAPAGAPK